MEQNTMIDEVDAILNSYNSSTLWEIIKTSNLSIRSKKLPKAEIILHMRKDFFTEKRVRHSVSQLNEREKEVLNRLQLRDFSVAKHTFKRELNRAGLTVEAAPPPPPTKPIYGYYQNEREHEANPNNPNSEIFEDVIARLTLFGLVFSRYEVSNLNISQNKLTFQPAETLYIPRIIRPFLPITRPLPPGQPVTPAAHIETADPQLFLRDLYLYWEYVRHNPVPMVQGGKVGKRTLKAINEILIQPDRTLENARREDETQQLFLLRLLLESLSLIQNQAGELQPIGKGSQVIPPFWKKPTSEQVKQCLEVWKNLTIWQELDNDVNDYLPNHTSARQLLIKGLSALQTIQWIGRKELLGWLQDQNQDFLFRGRAQLESSKKGYGSYLGNIYVYGNKKELNERLEQWEEKFVEICVTQFLFPLGIVEVGYHHDRPAPPFYDWPMIRLTSLGRHVLGLQPGQPPETDQGKIVVQPNFQILAIGPVNLATLAVCNSFAERKKIDRGAVEYYLSRESVYAAQQAGLTVKEIINWLVNISGTSLPQNVERSLQEWDSHHERIVFRTRTNLLQTATPNMLEQLLAHPEIGKWLNRLENTAVAVIQKEKVKPVVTALLKQNLLPVVAGEEPATANHSVLIDANGRIQPIHAIPSLHLRGRLARVAEETADGIWQITPESARRLGSGRDNIEQLLNELNLLQRGPLPPALITQLKNWGQYHGTATVQTLTLVEFQEKNVLQEILANTELRPYFTPFPAGERALAVITAENLPHLEQLLTQFGIPLIHQ